MRVPIVRKMQAQWHRVDFVYNLVTFGTTAPYRHDVYSPIGPTVRDDLANLVHVVKDSKPLALFEAQ